MFEPLKAIYSQLDGKAIVNKGPKSLLGADEKHLGALQIFAFQNIKLLVLLDNISFIAIVCPFL